MLPSDMELRVKTGTVGYNNKIFISDGNFSLGKNDEVNSLETPAISHKDSNLLKQTADSETAVTHKDLERKPTTTHEEERENCFNSFFNWNIYHMVPVSINLLIKTFHAYRISVRF